MFGRLSLEREQASPSRFVRQFLEDLDGVVEDARAAAGFLRIDLLRETPSRDQKWWEWLLAVLATNVSELLSYATRADLWPTG